MQFALYIVVIIYFFCNYFACVYRVVLVVFVSKDAIKSVPSNNNHLSPPLAASASCPSSTIIYDVIVYNVMSCHLPVMFVR